MNQPLFPWARFHQPIVWLGILAAGCNLAAATTEPLADSPKPYTLFMGADLSVVSKGTSLLVRDVENNSFVVNGPEGRAVVRGDDASLKLKLDDKLKVSSKFATVNGLAFDRVYSAANDPMTKFQDSARVSAYMSAGASNADAELRWSEAGNGLAQTQLALLPPETHPEVRAAYEHQAASTAALAAAAESSARVAQSMEQMQAFSPVANSVNMTSELSREQFDGLNISFEASAPRPLENPFIVVVMRYLTQKERPDTALVWIHAQRLPSLGEHPRKINIRRVGFPPGYVIDSYHVHIYDNATEVATSVSRKKVALTSSEAFDYAVIEYVGNNRNQTKAPLKALSFWPADLTNRLVPDKLLQTLFVKIAKDGRAIGLFEDENCTQPVADTEITALLPELRFLPALEKGKPVVSIAPVKLGSLN